MMRNTYKTIIALIAGTFVWSACNNAEIFEEEEVNVKVEMTTTATGDGVDTRTSIGDGNTVIWNEGDLISVFGKGKDNARFELVSGAGTTTGSFKGYGEPTTEYFAIYPYNGDSYLIQATGGQDELMVYWNGAQQTAVANSLSNLLMVAHTTNADQFSNNFSLSFQNSCALVKFTIDYRCKSINFTAKGGETVSAETIRMIVDENDKLSISDLSGTSSSVTLTGKDGEYIQAGTYYIAVLPGILASGFDLTFTNIYGEKTFTKSTSNKATLKRNTILNLGEISIKAKMIGMAGNGTSSDPYLIRDFDQLEEMRDFVNNSTGGADCYKLVNDIDGEGKDFTPIGTKDHPFAGNFDGNGKTIKNLKLGQFYTYVVDYGITSGYDNLFLRRTYISALFAIVRDAVLKNVTIDNMTMYDCEKIYSTQSSYAKSPFVGVCIGNKNSQTTISGVTVTVKQSCGLEETRLGLNYFYIYGGIVAASTGNLSIENCTNYSGIDGTYSYTFYNDDCNEGFFGGILGFAQGGLGDTESSGLDFGSQVKINKCRNFGDFKFTVDPVAHMNIGGILGSAWNYATDDDVCARIVNCVNFGTLLTTGDDDGIGGIVSSLHSKSIERVGGIVGYMNSDGYDGADPSIENCGNNGTIDTYKAAGGIVGVCDNDSDIKIDYCASYGTIRTTGYSSLIGNEADNVRVGYYKDKNGESAQACVSNMNNQIAASSTYCKWRLYSEDENKVDLVF